MSSCKMTLIGLYNYHNSIFENLTFPAGVDKDLAINEILMECGEFEILYSDIDFLKYQITKWGEKHYFTFEKWLKALAEEFNPIHNYDRYEEYTDTHSGSGKQIDSETRSDSDNRMRSESGESEHSDQHVDNAINTHSGEHSNDHSSSHDGTKTESNSTEHSESETSIHVESKDGTHGESKTSDSTGASFTDTHSTTDDDVKRNVSAYDASTYQPKEQEKTDGKTNGNGSGTSMSHVNDSSSGNDSETTNATDNKALDSSDNSVNNSSDSFNETASDDDTESSTDYESRNVNESGDASDKRNAFESGSSTGTADRQSEHTNTDVNKHEAHLYGNIGVTTSVAILTEFVNFYKDFNLYEQIAGLFVDEFCIRIY